MAATHPSQKSARASAGKILPTVSVLARRGREADAPLRLLGFDVESFPGYVNRHSSPHRVDVALLSFVMRGSGRHVIDDQSFACAAPSLGVTGYGQHHDLITTAAGMDVINLYLDLKNHPPPRLPAPLDRVLPDLLPLHPGFAHRLNRTMHYPLDQSEPWLGLLRNLESELRLRLPGYEETAASLLKVLLVYCCRHVSSQQPVPFPPATVHPAAGPLDALRRYLAANYAEPQTLAGLAARAGLSRTYLCRAFRAHTGKPLFDYLLERRLQAAMIALRASEQKVLAVALECGFQDLSYFNRSFRKLVGLTPTAYRRRVRQIPASR